jgi:hypothetical protein
MRRSSVLFVALFLLLPVIGAAEPVTLTLTGTVPTIGGVPSYFTGSAIQSGDPVTAVLTYAPRATLTGPDVLVDTYLNAVVGISATFSTTSGPITYSADNTLSATSLNFAAVRGTDVFFQITDSDQNGAAPPVVGPSVDGIVSTRPTTFVPQSLSLEFMGNFAELLGEQSLPAPDQLISGSSQVRLTVGTWGIGPEFVVQANYEGALIPRAQPVPEPGSLFLVAIGLTNLLPLKRRIERLYGRPWDHQR